MINLLYFALDFVSIVRKYSKVKNNKQNLQKNKLKCIENFDFLEKIYYYFTLKYNY